MQNRREDWRHNWLTGQCATTSATYPLDGRETIFDEYEKIMPTVTIGDYKAAQMAVLTGDERLPLDFWDYLAQRIPSTSIFYLYQDDTTIDRYGKFHKHRDTLAKTVISRVRRHRR